MGLIAAIAVVVALGQFFRLPDYVDRVTVQNPTSYDVRVEVAAGGRDGWMAVGTAQRDATTSFREVFDHGRVWVFRFSAQGETGGELRLTRRQLERSGWALRVPDAVNAQLLARGAPFPP